MLIRSLNETNFVFTRSFSLRLALVHVDQTCSHHITYYMHVRLHVDQTCSHHMMSYMYYNKSNNNNTNDNIDNNRYSCDGIEAAKGAHNHPVHLRLRLRARRKQQPPTRAVTPTEPHRTRSPRAHTRRDSLPTI